MANIETLLADTRYYAEVAAPGTPAAGSGVTYAKTDGKLYFKNDGGTEYDLTATSATSLVGAMYKRTSGDYSITGAGSDAFADVDATNLALTMTTGARRVLLGFQGTGATNNAAGGIFLDFMVDGVAQGGTQGLIIASQTTASEFMNCSFTYLTDVLTAASHTFKLRWRQASTAHTATLYGNTGASQLVALQMYAIEQPF